MTHAVSPARRWLLVPLLPLFLTACAVRPPEPEPDVSSQALFEERVNRLLAVDHWRTGGRAGFNTPDDNATVSMNWRQAGDRWVLDLRGPFGSGSLRMQGGDGGVVLRSSDGTVEQAEDAQELLYRSTGYDLPVEVLRDWLRGIPSTDFDARVQLDDLGRLTELEQLGWRIQYTAWTLVDGVYLPVRVFMDGPGINIRAALREWSLGRD